ncbi:unnamed protein product, partial [Laminaria digitata]
QRYGSGSGERARGEKEGIESPSCRAFYGGGGGFDSNVTTKTLYFYFHVLLFPGGGFERHTKHLYFYFHAKRRVSQYRRSQNPNLRNSEADQFMSGRAGGSRTLN